MTRSFRISRHWLVLGALGGGALLILGSPGGCDNSGTNGTDPCPNGICVNPDGGGPCVEDWVCTPWSTSGSGSNAGTRTCTDKNACGTTVNKPALNATLPALDLNYYKCNVEPILDKKCSQLACHGTETDRALRVYARARLRNEEMIPVAANSICFPGVSTISLAQQCTGALHCECNAAHTATEWQRNYDSVRAFDLDANLQKIPSGQEDSSDLLKQPVVGGKSHAGIHLFQSADPDYGTIKNWLSGATLATCNPMPN